MTQSSIQIAGRSAKLSECGVYRYDLERWWSGGNKKVCWIMLNPSTADADVDDATIRRCMGFSKLWGFDRLAVVNLFALRATDPAELRNHPKPTGGSKAESWYRFHRVTASQIVVAWGANGDYLDRGRRIAQDLVDAGDQLYCLGVTKTGQPKHPVRLAADTPLQPFNPEGIK